MTVPSITPSKPFGGILLSRHALLLVLVATAQLMTPTEGVKCYDCSYAPQAHTAGNHDDYPCHPESDEVPPTISPTDCPGSGCFSMHVIDHKFEGEEAWGYGSCLDDKVVHCIWDNLNVTVSKKDGAIAAKECILKNIHPPQDFEIRTKCIGGSRDDKDPGNGTLTGTLSYQLCACTGELCTIKGVGGAAAGGTAKPMGGDEKDKSGAPETSPVYLLGSVTIAAGVIVWTRISSN